VSFVIESGRREPPREWEEVESGHEDPDVAYEAMVNRALFQQAMYEPHGGRKLRVKEVTP
jgi:hypothetical protein